MPDSIGTILLEIGSDIRKDKIDNLATTQPADEVAANTQPRQPVGHSASKCKFTSRFGSLREQWEMNGNDLWQSSGLYMPLVNSASYGLILHWT